MISRWGLLYLKLLVPSFFSSLAFVPQTTRSTYDIHQNIHPNHQNHYQNHQNTFKTSLSINMTGRKYYFAPSAHLTVVVAFSIKSSLSRISTLDTNPHVPCCNMTQHHHELLLRLFTDLSIQAVKAEKASAKAAQSVTARFFATTSKASLSQLFAVSRVVEVSSVSQPVREKTCCHQDLAQLATC